MATPEDYILAALRSGTAASTSIAGGIVAREPVRQRMPIRNRSFFQGAQSDRMTASWSASPVSADSLVTRHQRTLVARSRDQVANNDYAKAFMRMVRQNVIGPNGIVMQALVKTASGKVDNQTNDALESAWDEWGNPENCDVTGKRSWRAILRSAVNDAARDGEYFVRIVIGKDAGPWGFAVQTIDPQRCPPDWCEPARSDGTFIQSGIRFNRFGRPLGYYFQNLDAGAGDAHYGGQPHTYVPADEIIHGFTEDLQGQKRGLPWMVTSLYRMRHMNGMEDAAVVNARVGAAKMGFIQWKDGYGPELEDDEEMPEITAEAGVFETLPEGAELKEWAPQYPNSEFAPFVKHMLRGMAAGWGVPYNELAADLEGVNFSSIRQGTLDSREHWKELQEWMIETLVRRVSLAWLNYSLLAGKIVTENGKALPAVKVDRYAKAISWQARRWDWIDPRADTASAVDRKNNFLVSPSAIIQEQGRDPRDVWNQTARDMRAMSDALQAEGFDKKTADELVLLSMGRAPSQTPQQPAAEGKPSEED